MQDELENKFDELLSTVHTGPVGECHCINCKPQFKRPRKTWEGNITAGDWCGKTAVSSLGAIWSPEPLHDELTGGTEGSCNKSWKVWVRKNAMYPLKVLAHELGHCVLGHNVYLDTPAACRYTEFFEMEAESVAMLVAHALGLDEAVPVARGYVRQFWKREIPPKSKGRIKEAARKILKAGREGANGWDDPIVGKKGDQVGAH